MQSRDNIVLNTAGIIAMLITGTMIFFYVTNTEIFNHVFQNHVKHYLIGFLFSGIICLIFFNKFTTEQKIIYFIIPAIIASGWPDILYFFSYGIQNGTFTGVLQGKNFVYILFHKVYAVISAAPILTGLVYLYDETSQQKAPYYYIFLVLCLTLILSISHVFLDRFYGF